MNARFPLFLAPVAAVALAAVPAHAVAFTPTQTQLTNLVAGSGTTAVNVANGTGATITLSAGDKGNFSEANLKSSNFSALDLTAFDTFQVDVTRDLATTGIDSGRIVVKTGSNFAFNTSATFGIAAGATETFTLDLAALPVLGGSDNPGGLGRSDIREIGFQFFGPGGGSVGQVLTITPTPIPEPASVAVLGALGGAALLRRRRPQA